jgi:hypothetical protein
MLANITRLIFLRRCDNRKKTKCDLLPLIPAKTESIPKNPQQVIGVLYVCGAPLTHSPMR